jgi:hypothetical protein
MESLVATMLIDRTGAAAAPYSDSVTTFPGKAIKVLPAAKE